MAFAMRRAILALVASLLAIMLVRDNTPKQDEVLAAITESYIETGNLSVFCENLPRTGFDCRYPLTATISRRIYAAAINGSVEEYLKNVSIWIIKHDERLDLTSYECGMLEHRLNTTGEAKLSEFISDEMTKRGYVFVPGPTNHDYMEKLECIRLCSMGPISMMLGIYVPNNKCITSTSPWFTDGGFNHHYGGCSLLSEP